MSTVGRTEVTTGSDGRSHRRERNAARIFDAADELLSRTTFDELRVEAICERAGVGRATFFRIFETKAGLLLEFNRRLAAEAAARLDAAQGADLPTSLEIIRAAIVAAWRDAGPGHIGMAQAFTQSTPGPDLHAAHPELLALVRRCIEDAMQRGDLPGTVPAELAASLALLQMIAPMVYVLEGSGTDFDALSRLMLRQWLNGMTTT
jgi:AcrR family transcriptional regulator